MLNLLIEWSSVWQTKTCLIRQPIDEFTEIYFFSEVVTDNWRVSDIWYQYSGETHHSLAVQCWWQQPSLVKFDVSPNLKLEGVRDIQ